MPDFLGVVVDNSNQRLCDGMELPGAVVLYPERNLGYGEAINLAAETYPAEFIAALNDDAEPAANWLEEMVGLFARHPACGMGAAVVRFPDGRLDSVGLGVAADGSSKQRRPKKEPAEEEVFCPSGAAAVYLHRGFAAAGGFDASFFLYCEDTDLGLRLQRMGYECWVAPRAEVLHHYSLSTGAASPLKAYYVERNRLRMVIKGWPASEWWKIVPATLWRYWLHLGAMAGGRGTAGAYREQGGSVGGLVWGIVRGHAEAALGLPKLWRQRARVLAESQRPEAELRERLRRFALPLAEVARQ